MRGPVCLVLVVNSCDLVYIETHWPVGFAAGDGD